MNTSASQDVPFKGFSLERSTSFAQVNDDFRAAEFEGHQIENDPKKLHQKYMGQNYSNSNFIDEVEIIREKGSVVAIKD